MNMNVMKIQYLVCTLALLASTVCHASPVALSAEGKEIKIGQTVFGKRAFLCISNDFFQKAKTLQAQKERMQAFKMFKAEQCGFIDNNERLKVIRFEPNTVYPAVVVSDLDDSKAPAELWISSDQLMVEKQ